ncbi:MAG: HIT domain-containing protein [Oscillospiraceae bacterium]|nr:HIT domain-containing protein [Oscillospiraceae bacterium]
MNGCIFCDIVEGKSKANILCEGKQVLAFYDVNPVAPLHFLVIPKIHINSVMELNKENSGIISEVFEVIAALAKELELENGFRVITNHGNLAGQTVDHIHFHVLGQRAMAWPPG